MDISNTSSTESSSVPRFSVNSDVCDKVLDNLEYLPLPAHSILNIGSDSGMSTSRLSCKHFARNIPRNENNLQIASILSESCGKGAGNNPLE